MSDVIQNRLIKLWNLFIKEHEGQIGFPNIFLSRRWISTKFRVSPLLHFIGRVLAFYLPDTLRVDTIDVFHLMQVLGISSLEIVHLLHKAEILLNIFEHVQETWNRTCAELGLNPPLQWSKLETILQMVVFSQAQLELKLANYNRKLLFVFRTTYCISVRRVTPLLLWGDENDWAKGLERAISIGNTNSDIQHFHTINNTIFNEALFGGSCRYECNIAYSLQNQLREYLHHIVMQDIV